jgi:NADH dehydrogenase [ubiquinone] 1 alpha subcomplex assembly factor 1
MDLCRFDDPTEAEAWSAIDDRVMGGASRSRLRFDQAGHAVFEGVVSRDRGGGFASVRSTPRALAAPGAQAYVVEVRGDGRRYKLNLHTDAGLDGVQYQAVIDPPAGVWTSLRVPVEAFLPTYRGRPVPGAPPLDPARVRQVGLMIADGRAGPFGLGVRVIAAAMT